jgi:hypothetical protein
VAIVSRTTASASPAATRESTTSLPSTDPDDGVITWYQPSRSTIRVSRAATTQPTRARNVSSILARRSIARR